MGQINIRLTEQELERVGEVQRRIQERERPEIKITQRIIYLRALEQLERYLDKLDSEKGRKR